MFNETNGYDLEHHKREVVREATAILERTGESIARSNQIAIETEEIGNEMISELGEQRESLLRTRGRLEDANQQLDNAKYLLSKMGRNVIYNKLILILIIILETLILIAVIYLRFFKNS
ncbi:vesicle transport through interaction with t-SNAREs homolog 1B [Cylas formicarius]|uniref:vesicle transport through interaction with t-SNAREs homolog 1B n=1 Tax=Cylas formicarius TaxID=197179 RepID=UPI002958D586|nr:vesicle transport through interaction with t-SNAREs homolog 1B [Cylas formicarius]